MGHRGHAVIRVEMIIEVSTLLRFEVRAVGVCLCLCVYWFSLFCKEIANPSVPFTNLDNSVDGMPVQII